MLGSNAEAVLDIRTNSGQFFTDIDKSERKSKELGDVFKRVAHDIEAFGKSTTSAGQQIAQFASGSEARMQQAARSFRGASEQVSGLQSTFAKLTSALTVANLITRAGSAVVAFGKDVIDSAGATIDLANKLGTTTEAVQRWTAAGKTSNVTTEQFADAAFKLGVKLSGGSGSVQQAVKDLGLSFQQLQGLRPEKQFDLIAEALEKIQNPQERNRIAMELFGKSASNVLPAIADGYTKLAKAATVATDAQLQAIDRASDAWDTFVEKQKTNLKAFLGNLVILNEFANKMTQEQWTAAFDIKTRSGVAEMRKFVLGLAEVAAAAEDTKTTTESVAAPIVAFSAELAKARAEVAALTSDQRKEIQAALDLGKNQDEITKRFNISESALRLFSQGLKQSTKDSGEFIKAWQKYQQLQIEKTLAKQAESAERLKVLTQGITINLQEAIDENDAFQKWHDIGQAVAETTAEFQVFETEIEDHVVPGMATLDRHTERATKEINLLEEGLRNIADGNFKLAFEQIGQGILSMVSGASLAVGILIDVFTKLLNKFVEVWEHVLAVAGNAVLKGIGKVFDFFVHSIGAMTAAAQAAAKIVDDLNAQKEAFADLDATIKKYKFSLQELGPALRRQRLDEQAQEIFHDWKILAAAGIDIAAIAREMGANINAFVQEAIRTGTEVPEALRPILEDMARMGLLTDEAGHAITDLNKSGLHFTKSLSDSFADLVKSVDRLTDAIERSLGRAGALGRAIANLPPLPGQTGSSGGSGTGAGNSGGENREAAGDYLHLMRPTRFLAGEAGREDVVFGGAGRNLARDVATELARLIPTPSPSHAGAVGGPVKFVMEVDGRVLGEVAVDNMHSGPAHTKARVLVNRIVGR